MYTIELECESGHAFEGWYDSAEDYESHLGGLSCPVCDSEFVMRRSSVKTAAGKMLMNLARKIKNGEREAEHKDQAGSLFFRLLVD